MMQISTPPENDFLKKYVYKKILWSIIALILVLIINIIIHKYTENYFNAFAQSVSENYILTGFSFFISEILIGIFPAELFMMIYQFKPASDYFLIVSILGIISSFCGLIAFLVGKYIQSAKIMFMILFEKKIKKYSTLFIKYGWVILTLAATTPLPFSMVSFIAGYYKFSPVTFLKIVVPVRILRFFISAFFIKYSMNILH